MNDSRQIDSAPNHTLRLPVEILQFIFEQATLCLFDDHPFEHRKSLDNSRITLSSVCSWWRKVVINHHRLWASISYEENGAPKSLEWIRLCLRRSGRHDLHLAIYFPVDYRDAFTISLPIQDRNPAIGRLVSFLDTVEDDMDRVRRFSVCACYPAYLHQLIIPNVRLPNLRRLLLTSLREPRTAIDAMMLGGLDQLELRVPTMQRTALASLLARCPSLRHLSLLTRAKPTECLLGGSALPALHVPHLQSLCLRGCVLPAYAFHAPELKRLLVSPDLEWWKTDHHHEEVAVRHFPQLRELVVEAWCHDVTYLEPSIRLIRAHPDISSLTLHGHSACDLLRNAFQPTPNTHTTIRPSMSEATAPKVSTRWKLQVPTALRSLVVNSLVGFNDIMLVDTLRHMLLASDMLHVTFLIRFGWENSARDYTYNAGDYSDYVALLTEFPWRFCMDAFALPLAGSFLECR